MNCYELRENWELQCAYGWLVRTGNVDDALFLTDLEELLAEACAQGDDAIVRKLLSMGVSTTRSRDNVNAIVIAAAWDLTSTIRTLLEHADPIPTKWLTIAACRSLAHENSEAVDMLFKRGAMITAQMVRMAETDPAARRMVHKRLLEILV